MKTAKSITMFGAMIAVAFMCPVSNGADLNLLSKDYTWEAAADGEMKIKLLQSQTGLKLEMGSDGDVESFPRIGSVFEKQDWSKYKTIVVEVGNIRTENNELLEKGKEIALCIYDESLKNGNDFVQTIAGSAIARIGDKRQKLSFDISKCARTSVRHVDLYIYERPLQKGENLSFDIDAINLK
jgi:hypothetical protein